MDPKLYELLKQKAKTEVQSRVGDTFTPKPVIDIDVNDDNVNATVHKHTNPISDYMHAKETVNDDPETKRLKQKAMKHTAIVAGAGLGAAALRSRFPDIKHGSSSLWKTLKDKPVLGILGVAAPLLGYYAYTHKDKPKRARNADTASKGMYGVAIYQGIKDETGKDPFNLTKGDLKVLGNNVIHNPSAYHGVLNGIGSASLVRATDYYQRVDDIERVRAIKADPKLTEQQREWMIRQITEKNDVQSRYPLLRWTPGSRVIRNTLNKHRIHTPEFMRGVPTDFIRVKIRE